MGPEMTLRTFEDVDRSRMHQHAQAYDQIIPPMSCTSLERDFLSAVGLLTPRMEAAPLVGRERRRGEARAVSVLGRVSISRGHCIAAAMVNRSVCFCPYCRNTTR
jgi:hypothetical protein